MYQTRTNLLLLESDDFILSASSDIPADNPMHALKGFSGRARIAFYEKQVLISGPVTVVRLFSVEYTDEPM